MDILSANYHLGALKLKVENLDDLWYLSYVIEPGDLIKARTFRKIKLGDEGDRTQKIVKKPVWLTICVEKIEFHKYADVLRVSGKVTEGPENITQGSYHTINVEPQTIFSLKKETILAYQKEKLEEAKTSKEAKILICLHDREEALIAFVKKYGYEIATHVKGDVVKKEESSTKVKDFYKELRDIIAEYDQRMHLDAIIIASPSFWKEHLLAKIKDPTLQKKIISSSASSVSRTGLSEVMKRDEVLRALKETHVSQEMVDVQRVLTEISREGPVSYGFDETKNAILAGAAAELFVTDSLIKKRRQDSTFVELESLMRSADKSGTKIHIISSDHDGGETLDGLGGIAAILRYKLNY